MSDGLRRSVRKKRPRPLVGEVPGEECVAPSLAKRGRRGPPRVLSHAIRSQQQAGEFTLAEHNQPRADVPSADKIAEALFRRIQSSGMQLPQAATAVADASGNHSRPVEHQDPNDVASAEEDVASRSDNNQGVLNTGSIGSQHVPSVSVDGDFTNARANAVPLISSSLPLGYNVSDKIKGTIWGDLFVDFAMLIPNFQQDDETVLYQSLQSTLKLTNAKQKKISNIWQWCDGFDIFASIYFTRHPQATLPLIKHGNVVRNMAQEFGFAAAKFYDEEFRKVRGMLGLAWGHIHDELWRKALGSYQKSASPTSPSGSNNVRPQRQPFSRGPQQEHNMYPKGFCWRFCRTGQCSCTNCKWVSFNLYMISHFPRGRPLIRLYQRNTLRFRTTVLRM